MKSTLIRGSYVEPVHPAWLWIPALAVPLLYLAAIGAVAVATELMR